MNKYKFSGHKKNRNDLSEIDIKAIPGIRVCVRKRPVNKKEIKNNDIDILEIQNSTYLIVKELKNKVDLTKYIEEHKFKFDFVFNDSTTNKEIYITTVKPMISAAFKTKAKVSCFAYGQTGSGKTYTMLGDPHSSSDLLNPGLYLLSFYDIFSYLQKKEYTDLEIWVSFFEIYCNKLYDLLNDRNSLQAREDGKGNICIVGLVEKQIINLKHLMNIIDFGLKSRTTGVTGANNDSSRSHAILQISLKDQQGEQQGKISFIDLAGSERAVDTVDTDKKTKIDGAEINKSLLALKECIRAMDQGKLHKPFRGSKLTLVLRDSFIGNCLTLMIANVSPCLSCSEHTLNTLRYADRVKELKMEKSELDTSTVNANKMESELMMPRQHNKTVKYEVNMKNSKYCLNEGNFDNNKKRQGRKEITHINEIISPKEGKHIIKNFSNNIKGNNNNIGNLTKNGLFSSSSNTNNNAQNTSCSEKRNVDNICIDLLNENSGNNENNYHSCNSNYNSLKGKRLNNFLTKKNKDKEKNTSHTVGEKNRNRKLCLKEEKEHDQEKSKYKDVKVLSDEDFQKYSNEHQKLVDLILDEEEKFKMLHKKHIEEMTELIKQEILKMQEVEKPGSDIEAYTISLSDILKQQVDNINKLRKRLTKFQILIKEEEVLASKFENPNELVDVFINSSKNNNNNSNSISSNLKENTSNGKICSKEDID